MPPISTATALPHALVALALAAALALVLAAGLRLAGGAAALRLAGVAAPAGALAAWGVAQGIPIPPVSLAEVAMHITLGGLLLGLGLDALTAWRGWSITTLRRLTLLGGIPFLLVGVWEGLGRPRTWPTDAGLAAGMATTALLLGLGWLAVLGRLGRHLRSDGAADGHVLLVALGLGVAAAALALGADGPALAAGGLALAAGVLAAIHGLARLRLGLRQQPAAPPLSAAAVLGGGGAVIGLAQALALDWPGGAAAVAVLAFLPFVEPTAERLPGRRWLWTLALALLPALLAAMVVVALGG